MEKTAKQTIKRLIISTIVLAAALLLWEPAAGALAGVNERFDGAESLIADVITGVFMLFEHQYEVGDIIVADDFRGTVTDPGAQTSTVNITLFDDSQRISAGNHVSQGFLQLLILN